MSLELNDAVHFKEFYGPPNEQMPLLIADGRIPLSLAGLMRRRLEVLEEGIPYAVRNAWWDNSFSTGDLFAGHPDGRFKIVLDSPLIRYLNPKTPLYRGAIRLGKTAEEAALFYEGLQGKEFSRKDLEERLNRFLKRDEIKANQVLLELARGDQSLLNDYTDAIFDLLEQKYRRTTGKGICVPEASKRASERLWFVGCLRYGSVTDGSFGVDYKYGRLVGVAPETQYAKKSEPISKLVQRTALKYGRI